MQIHTVDIAIIVIYMVGVVLGGVLLSRRAAQNMENYFLGGRRIPWYILGISNASGMFDITGTMLMVTWFFVYGLKSAWIPWLWPTFNQVVYMVFLTIWLRRSGVMTGAEWIRTRFGDRLGGELSHISVVVFAIVATIGFMAYAFEGIGKFAAVFLPWELSPNTYAVVFMGITTVYVILGGMYSVVLTDVIQYIMLTVASFFIAGIAISRTSAENITAVVPEGWWNLGFGLHLNLDWSQYIAAVNDKITSDGYSLFGIFFILVLLKGILASVAGPPPNKDMQRMLSTKTARESALMTWSVSIVLYVPRYLMIGGITVLGLVFFSRNLNAMGSDVDFEQILPYVINNFVPVGLTGVILAGLIAAFMSTFDSTVNNGAAYIVNDIYKRYINPHASDRRYVVMSYIASFLIVGVGIFFGYKAGSIHAVTAWIVAGLYGGYIAPNVLKWYWWKFNGFGYFAGMVAGILSATLLMIPRSFYGQTTFLDLEYNIAMFPVILGVSTLASVVVSLLTKPDDEEVLKSFYRRVRPWGFWKPVLEMVRKDEPDFQANTAFKRDAVNVVVGIIWQLNFYLIPMYLVLQMFRQMWISAAVLAVTSVFLKKNWYDKLEDD